MFEGYFQMVLFFVNISLTQSVSMQLFMLLIMGIFQCWYHSHFCEGRTALLLAVWALMLTAFTLGRIFLQKLEMHIFTISDAKFEKKRQIAKLMKSNPYSYGFILNRKTEEGKGEKLELRYCSPAAKKLMAGQFKSDSIDDLLAGMCIKDNNSANFNFRQNGPISSQPLEQPVC